MQLAYLEEEGRKREKARVNEITKLMTRGQSSILSKFDCYRLFLAGCIRS